MNQVHLNLIFKTLSACNAEVYFTSGNLTPESMEKFCICFGDVQYIVMKYRCINSVTGQMYAHRWGTNFLITISSDNLENGHKLGVLSVEAEVAKSDLTDKYEWDGY